MVEIKFEDISEDQLNGFLKQKKKDRNNKIKGCKTIKRIAVISIVFLLLLLSLFFYFLSLSLIFRPNTSFLLSKWQINSISQI